MSFFSKTPIQQIDYDINPSDWDATNTTSTAKLSLQRMKHKDTDKKKQQQIREKSWYVDIPFFLKGIVPDGQTFKVADVEPEMKGRFYGKDPASAKGTFETYFTLIKDQETKKLQQKLKELKIKKVIKASETADKIMAEGNPSPPSPDVTEVLSQGENPIEYRNNNSPFADLQVNSVSSPQQRLSKLSAAEIQARKNASKTRKLERKRPVASLTENTTPLPEATFTSSNVNALASQQRIVASAERALAAPTSVTNPMAQRNKLRAAAKGIGKVQPASRSLNKRQTSLTGYGPSNRSKFQTRKRSIVSQNPAIASAQKSLAQSTMTNSNLNQQISTMFD